MNAKQRRRERRNFAKDRARELLTLRLRGESMQTIEWIRQGDQPVQRLHQVERDLRAGVVRRNV